MDVVRMTQLGSWSGSLSSGGVPIEIGGPTTVYGTKDRSWGIRPIGHPAPAAPSSRAPGIFFLWAPLHFADECLHYIVFEDANGVPWSKGAAILPVIGPDDPVYGPDLGFREVSVTHAIDWQPGLRRSRGATLTVAEHGGEPQPVTLEPTLTFRMRGAGYLHPRYAHGVWHGEEVVDGEEHNVEDLDTLDLDCLHVQQVMRATWGDRVGVGVLEQLVIGPHAPSGFRDYFDGAPR
jgi:hypothetical protein